MVLAGGNNPCHRATAQLRQHFHQAHELLGDMADRPDIEVVINLSRQHQNLIGVPGLSRQFIVGRGRDGVGEKDAKLPALPRTNRCGHVETKRMILEGPKFTLDHTTTRTDKIIVITAHRQDRRGSAQTHHGLRRSLRRNPLDQDRPAGRSDIYRNTFHRRYAVDLGSRARRRISDDRSTIS